MSTASQSKKSYKKRKSNGNAGNDQPRAFFHVPSVPVSSTIISSESADSSNLGLSEAELYLLSVRAEEASLPTFTKALNPYAIVSASSAQPIGAIRQKESTVLSTVIGTSALPRHPFLPSEAWRSSFLLHFHNLRQNLQAIPYNSNSNTSITLPKASDGPAWRSFIFGAKRRKLADLAVAEATFIPTSRDIPEPVQDDEESFQNEGIELEDWGLDGNMDEGYDRHDEEEGNGHDYDEEEQMNDHKEEEDNVSEDELEPFDPSKHTSREPTMSVIKTMPDKTVIYLLRHITSWITDPPSSLPQIPSPSLPPIVAHWSFSLLLVLDAHLLSGESISDLRSLARACLAVIERQLELHTSHQDRSDAFQRSRQEDEDERMACWMIWELIVEVWKQRDLREEEQALFK